MTRPQTKTTGGIARLPRPAGATRAAVIGVRTADHEIERPASEAGAGTAT